MDTNRPRRIADRLDQAGRHMMRLGCALMLLTIVLPVIAFVLFALLR